MTTNTNKPKSTVFIIRSQLFFSLQKFMYSRVYNIEMASIVETATTWCKANQKACAVAVGVLVMTLVIWAATSGFVNNPNAIRRYIVATDGVSLDDKMNAAQKSGLTGSRDAPVFFSDFDIEMKKNGNGDLVAERSEQFTNEKAGDITNIEDRFMLH
jgi:uncharacterized membrane protein YcgQ (UPF0703/DUF1980 family)